MKMKHIIAGLALLAMPFTAQAEVREAGLVDGFGMSLIYPAVHTKNIAAENAINKDITGYVRRMKELYESGEKQEVYMTYTTKYEDEDLVSIVLETSSVNEGMADRNAQAYGLVYNKKTGDLLRMTGERQDVIMREMLIVIPSEREGSIAMVRKTVRRHSR